MFKSNSFSTKRAYDAPLCETLDVRVELSILDMSRNVASEAGGVSGKDNSSDPSFYYDL